MKKFVVNSQMRSIRFMGEEPLGVDVEFPPSMNDELDEDVDVFIMESKSCGKEVRLFFLTTRD